MARITGMSHLPSSREAISDPRTAVRIARSSASSNPRLCVTLTFPRVLLQHSPLPLQRVRPARDPLRPRPPGPLPAVSTPATLPQAVTSARLPKVGVGDEGRKTPRQRLSSPHSGRAMRERRRDAARRQSHIYIGCCFAKKPTCAQ
ncbi:hypothetical protein AAY473_000841 [Plecturocebus cupreus]